MAASLRDELASLKIDRREAYRPAKGSGRRRRGGFGGSLIWLIPLSLLGGAGAFAYVQYDKIRPRVEVSVGMVQAMTSGEAEKLLSAKGYIKSRHQAMIGSKLPGRVAVLNVEEGTRVKKGDVIAVLEHDDLKAQLASRQATVRRTEAELREAKVDLRDKRRKAAREERLLAQGRTSAEAVEAAEAARDMAGARVEALEAALELMRASAREAEETIRNMHVYAPFDGTIVVKAADVGETIIPGGLGGNSGRGSVVTLANLGELDVETDITENLLGRIARGQPAEISVSAVPDRHYRGRLRSVIPMGDRTRGTVKVKVEVLDADDRLFPELVATVHFLPDKALENPNAGKSFLFVPRDAVVEENGHTLVWVVDGKQRVARKAVEVAATDEDLARVESGLKGGETVVLHPPKALREGETVKVVD